MGWVLAIGVSLVAWAFYWPAGWLEGHLWVPVAVTATPLCAYACIRLRRARIAADAMALERGIVDQAEQHALHVSKNGQAEIRALQHHFLEGVSALKNPSSAGKGGAAALCALPWYVIIGPPGAGKTTALQASGLSFPLAGPDGARVRGVGGTRNCEWWLADEAIFLDTAGRYTTEADDREEWLAFLGLLRRYRRRAPINGVIVAISVTDLADASESQIGRHGKQIRARLDELMSRLEVAVPVYVLFTKADLIAGFVEMFADLKKSDRKQPWGATLRLSADRSNPRNLFEAELDLLLRRLHARSMERLASEPMPARCPGIHRFPLELEALRDNLAALVETVFSVNPYQGTPLFRGFYFTSGTQEGRPLQRVLRRMSEAMDLAPAEGPERESREAKSYFLHDVFANIVFKDASLVAISPGRVRRERLARLATAAVTAVFASFLCVMAVVSFGRNDDMLETARKQTERARGLSWHSPVSENLTVLEPLLGQLQTLDAHREEGVPVELGWMMYQGERIHEPTLRAYLSAVQSGFVAPCKRALEERLRLVKGETYLTERRTLKAYLMLDDSAHDFEHLDVEWATGQYTELWFGLVAGLDDRSRDELRRKMADHVRYYFTLLRSGRVTPVPLDEELVARVRQTLGSVPLARRYYDELVTSVADQKIDEALGDGAANLRYPPLTLAGTFSAYPVALRFMSSANLEEQRAWQRVPGPYTEMGHHAVVGNIALGKTLLDRDAWVVPLGPDEPSDTVARRIEVVASEYERRYIDAWMGLLSDVTVRSPRTLREAVVLYKGLANAPWPYATILRALQDHTQWPVTRKGREREKAALALAEVLRREKLSPRAKGIPPTFDVTRIGDRVSLIPSLFARTVELGVPPSPDERSEPGSLAVTPLAKYVSRLDTLRRQIEQVLDEDEDRDPRVLAAQLADAAREAEALVAAQLARSPDPGHADPAKLLLKWLWCPLQVGDVPLPTPRLVPTRIECQSAPSRSVTSDTPARRASTPSPRGS